MRDARNFILTSFGISGLIVVVYYVNARRFSWEYAGIVFAISFVHAIITGGLATYAIPRLAPFLRGTRPVFWVQMVLLLLALGVAGGSAGYLLLTQNPFYPLSLGYQESITANIVFTIAIGTISTFAALEREKLEATTLELRTKELEKERALKAASEAQLRSLESRVHPHFLFNTLNSISALVRKDPETAEELIQRLAALLRFSLDRHASLVTVGDELQVTLDYLEIEKVRFGERLRYEISVPPELLSVEVPALSLQTLVENSVKYAVGVSRAGADIRVTASRVGQEVAFEVTDNGPGFRLDSLPAGHGLDTLRQRLQAFFGETASLSATALEPGVSIRFRVPC